MTPSNQCARGDPTCQTYMAHSSVTSPCAGDKSERLWPLAMDSWTPVVIPQTFGASLSAVFARTHIVPLRQNFLTFESRVPTTTLLPYTSKMSPEAEIHFWPAAGGRWLLHSLDLLYLGNQCLTSHCVLCCTVPRLLPPQTIHTSDVKNRNNSPLSDSSAVIHMTSSLPYTIFCYIKNIYLHFYTPRCEQH